MSEYQSDNGFLQSRHISDNSKFDTQESLQIEDNRIQSVTQRKVQNKLAYFFQLKKSDVLQKEGGLEEEELPVQSKFIAVQKFGNSEEDELVQGKFNAESAIPQLATESSKQNNTGLPDNLKSGIENLSGLSLDDVQVHYNSNKPAQLQALAYTQGTDIHVAPGQEKHLPHEVWHVVQQMQGRVQPTIEMNGGVQVNDNTELENEADIMGQKVF